MAYLHRAGDQSATLEFPVDPVTSISGLAVPVNLQPGRADQPPAVLGPYRDSYRKLVTLQSGSAPGLQEHPGAIHGGGLTGPGLPLGQALQIGGEQLVVGILPDSGAVLAGLALRDRDSAVSCLAPVLLVGAKNRVSGRRD
jgi:hypothetical protein